MSLKVSTKILSLLCAGVEAAAARLMKSTDSSDELQRALKHMDPARLDVITICLPNSRLGWLSANAADRATGVIRNFR